MATGRGLVVVAGGAGFIGSHLCEALLDRGERVLCVDSLLTGSAATVAALRERNGFRFLRRDVMEPWEPDEAVAAVMNLACAASPPRYQADPVHTLLTSVAGTARLLELAERHGARFLQASTSEVYGDPAVHPQDEDYPGSVSCTGPRACYDEGKRAAETLCADFNRLGRVDARVARIFNTYGPRMRPDDGRVISNLIVQALAGGKLTVYGDGTQTRSFCFISDLVRGLLALLDLDRNPGGPVNLGNPAELSVGELAERIARAIPGAAGIERRPLPVDDPRRRCPDIARARRLLGWQPAVPLDEGLERTAAFFAAARRTDGTDGIEVPDDRTPRVDGR